MYSVYSRFLFFLLLVLRDLAFVVIFSCSFNLFLVLVVFHVSFSRRVLALCPSFSALLPVSSSFPFPASCSWLPMFCPCYSLFFSFLPCFFLFFLVLVFVSLVSFASCSFSWVSAFFLLPFFPAFLLSLACSCSFPCHSSLQRSPC